MAEEINNYIEDDWGDNKLINRDSDKKGLYYSYNQTGTGDILKGVYRPRWTHSIDSGSLTIENGKIKFSAGSNTDRLNTPSNLESGVFKYEQDWISVGNDYGAIPFYFITDGSNPEGTPNNALRIKPNDNGEYKMDKVNSGSFTRVVDGSWAASSGYYVFKVERNSYGNISIFENGASRGTNTDSYLPSEVNLSSLVFSGSNSNSDIHLENLQIM